MGTFKLKVSETVSFEKIYTVEAETLDEAIEKAHNGDIIKEYGCKQLAVVSRVIIKNLTKDS